MSHYISKANIRIDQSFYQFIEKDVLSPLSLSSDEFWQGVAELVADLTPVNKALLDKRQQLQQQIDNYHQKNKPLDSAQYKTFLSDISYLESEVNDFSITTDNVDDELAKIAAPQLVVPIMNARFALNAVNARWGSLYDALYGTDVISTSNGAENTGVYNPVRGQQVIEFAKNFLDEAIPLEQGSHNQAIEYHINNSELVITLADGAKTTLTSDQAWLGYTGTVNNIASLMFIHNNLHIEIKFDKEHQIGKRDVAGISDILIESALTTIMDCEDSVAAVDAEDKIISYKNWLGLMQGTLETSFTKNGQQHTRKMSADKSYTSIQGESVALCGRSVMFVRNVGHLMQNNTILDQNEIPIYEGILDAIFTSLIALFDLNKENNSNSLKNSKTGSIYIVKPKMHGSEEVAFANNLFDRVEDLLNLPRHTIKMGIMDEERRTSLNLKNCIHAAKNRVVFINTGFLDRTGDEIHTSMHAGTMTSKLLMKQTKWLANYEQSNVAIGLKCGLSGKAQIGKGMWAIPDNMADMMAQKKAQLSAGATTAWVPSPTAATLHALHYHQENPYQVHEKAMLDTCYLDNILHIPLLDSETPSEEQVTLELENNIQGILGYVVRWIDQGIGCSKVPDVFNVGLMEDRATLRISSQHVANWLLNKVCSEAQVTACFEKMASIVDKQNANDPQYRSLLDGGDNNLAMQAAKALVFEGLAQPNGYTEPLLHAYRLRVKDKNKQ